MIYQRDFEEHRGRRPATSYSASGSWVYYHRSTRDQKRPYMGLSITPKTGQSIYWPTVYETANERRLTPRRLVGKMGATKF
jgi:hypothetical protein